MHCKPPFCFARRMMSLSPGGPAVCPGNAAALMAGAPCGPVEANAFTAGQRRAICALCVNRPRKEHAVRYPTGGGLPGVK